MVQDFVELKVTRVGGGSLTISGIMSLESSTGEATTPFVDDSTNQLDLFIQAPSDDGFGAYFFDGVMTPAGGGPVRVQVAVQVEDDLPHAVPDLRHGDADRLEGHQIGGRVRPREDPHPVPLRRDPSSARTRTSSSRRRTRTSTDQHDGRTYDRDMILMMALGPGLPTLLVVHHSPTSGVRALTDAVLAGAC